MIAEVLIFAELTGKNTQGLIKLLGTEPAQEIKPQYSPRIIKETQLSALIDGGGVAGPLAAQIASDKAIEIAKKSGFGVIGTNNTFSSIGAAGYYARKIAQHGLIGIVSANSPRALVPYGGIEPTYGTNPIAFGFPTKDNPVVFDMASSATTWYGLVRAKAMGQKLQNNVAVNKKGDVTTDPEEAMQGAILPFDKSYKGSGLAMVVELLAGALTGASFIFDEGDWGTFILAFNPSLLIGEEQFSKNASDLIKNVKASKAKFGKEIHIPVYDTEINMQKKLQTGEIEIDPALVQRLRAMTV